MLTGARNPCEGTQARSEPESYGGLHAVSSQSFTESEPESPQR